MSTYTPEQQQWLDDYLDALPAHIRPHSKDLRFINAAGLAYRAGWSGRSIGEIVAGRSYVGASNPVLVGIMNLEDLGSRPPQRSTRPPKRTRHPNGCIVCPPWAKCDHPVPEERLSPEHRAARWALIDRIARDGIPAEEAGYLMACLIEEQNTEQLAMQEARAAAEALGVEG